jgi:cytosine/adenosine deaminase-related metal-dependent hydrolase
MDDQRRVIRNGAIAVTGQTIIAVGQSEALSQTFDAKQQVDGRHFVITPGLVNGHIHVTGDPLTRAWLPDNIDADFEEELTEWVLPRFFAHQPEDECVSAELSSLKMLRSGTTCFIEAGTVQHLESVVRGASRTGIRGRVGSWIEGRDSDSKTQSGKIDAAIRALEDEARQFPANNGERIAAWPILVGHSTNPDEVWLAAKRIADDNGLGISAHMSPYASDPEWFLKHTGLRPIEHLAKLGVLGSNVCLTHLAHIDEAEQDLLAATRTNAVFCPLAALRGVFGLTNVGRFPEMAAAGINILLGSDGFDHDMMRQAQMVSALFKDVRKDVSLFPAQEMLTMLTRNGATALGLEREIGSLEAGKKADFVCHDTDRPEWQPVIGVVNQLAWLADGRSVHSVWVDGVRVIDDYRSTQIDETELYARAAASSAAVIDRSGLPFISPWPVS